jgi:hypothetical protein
MEKVKEIFGSRLTYVFILALIFGVISINALRQNYTKMTELRTAVAVADEQNGDVEKALQDLRAHVHGHMNTNLASGNSAIKPPIQLKARYERLKATEVERIKSVNAQVTAEAERICGGQFPGGGFNAPRVQCVQNYVAQNALAESTIADDLYKFDFISPTWSPDRAGISLVISILLSAVFLFGIAWSQIKKRYLL